MNGDRMWPAAATHLPDDDVDRNDATYCGCYMLYMHTMLTITLTAEPSYPQMMIGKIGSAIFLMGSYYTSLSLEQNIN